MRNSSLFILLLFLAAHSVQATPGDPRQDPFLEEVQRRTLRYFIDTTPVETGLAPDRYPSPGPSSIAAVGYALTAFPIAVEHRMLTRAQALNRATMKRDFKYTDAGGLMAAWDEQNIIRYYLALHFFKKRIP